MVLPQKHSFHGRLAMDRLSERHSHVILRPIIFRCSGHKKRSIQCLANTLTESTSFGEGIAPAFEIPVTASSRRDFLIHDIIDISLDNERQNV